MGSVKSRLKAPKMRILRRKLKTSLTEKRWNDSATKDARNGIDTAFVTHETLVKNNKNVWIQLAGHPDSFVPGSLYTVCKKQVCPYQRESKTYQALMDDPLCDVVPKFYRQFEQNNEVFIEIEDLLHRFSDPNVMDIKMGTRTFLECEVKNMELRGDLYEKMVSLDASEPTAEENEQKAITKLRYMQFREKGSTSTHLGFRIEAVRLSGELAPNKNVKFISTEDAVARTFLSLFGRRQSVWERLLQRLHDIRSRFETSQFFKHHEIIGSSLLVICDDTQVGVWMIDFAKTLHVPDRLLTHRDAWQFGNHEDGYLIGIDNLIKIVSKILSERRNSNTNGLAEAAVIAERCTLAKSELNS